VEASFQTALAIARRQGAKSLELRAAVSLARLWRQQDKAGEGRELVGEIYSGFTEGFGAPDLQGAQEVLE
jgi:predicted ATPase